MPKINLSFVLRILSALPLFVLGSGQPIQATQNINTRLVQKSLVYLFQAAPVGNADQKTSFGTGFLVRIPLRSNPNAGYIVLVTARHIVDPAWDHCPEIEPQDIFVRFNKKAYDHTTDESGVVYANVQLSAHGVPAWRHPVEEDADVAVVLLDAKELYEKTDADAGAIPISDFATDEEAKLRGATDPVDSVGLLPPNPEIKRNYPVWKFGYISSEPDEPVPSQCASNGVPTFLRLWLLSINLIPGNSGSPIFYVPEGANGASFGDGRTSLIGLQSVSYLGADISGMTPVRYIFEAIQSLNLQDADLYRGPLQNKTPK